VYIKFPEEYPVVAASSKIPLKSTTAKPLLAATASMVAL